MPFDTPPELVARVTDFVWKVPRGSVVSYGQIASALGLQDSRVIGWIMHGTGSIPDFPWWRVLNNEGKITIKDPAIRARQKELLEAEGITVGENYQLDMNSYRYGAPRREQKLL
jgi:methylated-DNA-protein-cysteine methyltransferase-like protein